MDLGCGPGRFLLLSRQRADTRLEGEGEGELNYLGLEIRKPVRGQGRKVGVNRLGLAQSSLGFLGTVSDPPACHK